MRFVTTVVAALMAVQTLPATVQAGGLEFVGAGSQALGRGGAVTAKSEDPMVLAYNPAGLADLQGNQLLLDNSVVMMHACADPIGYYGWGLYGGGSPTRLRDPRSGEVLELNLGESQPTPETAAYYTDKLDTVCMKERPFPIPQLGLTSRLSDRLGIGFGLIFPEVTPQGQWGESNGVIRGANGLRPTPTRYQMINAGTLGVFPTLGVGYRLAKWLRIGAAIEWGIVNVDNTVMAATVGGANPAADILSRVQTTDWFVPGATASVHIVPFDSVDIVAAVRWQDDVHGKGTIDLTTGSLNPNAIPTTTTNQVVELVQNMPWKLRGGIRYASRLVPRLYDKDVVRPGEATTHRLADPFETERWDVEADLEYQMNSRNQETRITYSPMQIVNFNYTNGSMSPQNFPQPARPGGTADTVLPRHWQDQLSVRVGGSYNVLPGFFGLNWGAHYETRGIDPAYMQIDYWPVSRMGFHAGVRFRVAHAVDLVFSYAHIMQETITVGALPHGEIGAIYKEYETTGHVSAIDKRAGVAMSRGQMIPPLEEAAPATPETAKSAVLQNTTQTSSSNPPWVTNAGTYRSSIDVVALGVNVHF